jgi:hypothetical protein
MRNMAISLTRSARWVSNYANVPRLGLRPNLLLDFATSDTQRTLLGVVGVIAGVMGSTVLLNEREL